MHIIESNLEYNISFDVSSEYDSEHNDTVEKKPSDSSKKKKKTEGGEFQADAAIYHLEVAHDPG
jgi:hypothetical protein